MSTRNQELTGAAQPRANLVTETTRGTPYRGQDGWLRIEYMHTCSQMQRQWHLQRQGQMKRQTKDIYELTRGKLCDVSYPFGRCSGPDGSLLFRWPVVT